MLHRINLMIRSCTLILLAVVSSLSNAQADTTFSTLFSFNGGNGSSPYGDLTLNGSTLYGMTPSGGTGYGNIFSINTDGTGFQTLFSFDGINGASPLGSLTLHGSTLYGMTTSGGDTSRGNIFSINTNGTGFQNLFSFDGINADPQGSLTLSGSTLYGMAKGGIVNDGTIFRINTDGTGFQTLLTFNGTNGGYPYGSLTLSGSTLYGMTEEGGINNEGTIFSINTDGTGFQTRYSFTGGADGGYPQGSLTLSGSTLYGMTGLGGDKNYGTIFRINTNGTGFQTLGINSASPYGSLTLSGSTLYGMAQSKIFSINTDGTGFQTLYNNGSKVSYGSLTFNGSTLYGMTNNGGTASDGSIFALSLTVPKPEYIYWKGGNNDTSTAWGVANNWNPSSNVPDGPGVKVSFGSQSSISPIVDMVSTGRTVGCIAFVDTTSTTIRSTYGFALTLDNNGSVSTIDVAGIHTISALVVLNNDTTISGTGTLTLSGGISGSHNLEVDINLTASSIQVDTLTISSGATVTIQAIPGGPLALSDNLKPVPEPSTFVLLGIGVIGLIGYTWRRWKQTA